MTRKFKTDQAIRVASLLLGIALLTGLMAGCASAAPPPSPTAVPTATPLPSVTPTETPVPFPTPIPLGGPEITDFSFAVCGDSHTGLDVYQEILRNVVEEGNAFMIHTGDMVNRGRADLYQPFAEIMADFPLPFFPAAGNHDSADGFLDEFLQYSGAPAEHYSFDYGQGHFLIVDSHLGALSSTELSWLEADLAATGQPLKMVFLHHPPFSPEGSDSILHGGNETFMDLMTQYGVIQVHAGHHHAFEYENRDGVDYYISGLCGGPIDPGEIHHYLRVTVSGTEVSTDKIEVELPEGGESQ